jgi:hypothetical protein
MSPKRKDSNAGFENDIDSGNSVDELRPVHSSTADFPLEQPPTPRTKASSSSQRRLRGSVTSDYTPSLTSPTYHYHNTQPLSPASPGNSNELSPEFSKYGFPREKMHARNESEARDRDFDLGLIEALASDPAEYAMIKNHLNNVSPWRESHHSQTLKPIPGEEVAIPPPSYSRRSHSRGDNDERRERIQTQHIFGMAAPGDNKF